MEEIPTIVWVAAAALRRSDGRWLMHRRPQDKHHGGLWEFPGGKLERGETPAVALSRELKEELGIEVAAEHFQPAGFAETTVHRTAAGLVILLYTGTRWRGEAKPLQPGAAVDWFDTMAIANLDLPPLDRVLFDRILHADPLRRSS